MALNTWLIGPETDHGPWREALGSDERVGTVALLETAAGNPSGIDLIVWMAPEPLQLDPLLATLDVWLASHPTLAVLLVGRSLGARELAAMMQGGIREVVLEPAHLAGAIARAARFQERLRRAAPEPHPVPEPGKIIAVHGPRGGSGKTTLATNLAIALARTGSGPVTLLEAVPAYPTLDLALNLEPSLTLAELVRAGRPDDYEEATLDHATGVRWLAVTRSPEETTLIHQGCFGRTLTSLAARGGWVVVDVPSEPQEAGLETLQAADTTLVPMFPDLIGFRELRQAEGVWQAQGVDTSRWDVVLWDAPSRFEPASIERAIGRRIRHRLPHAPELAQAALDRGEPILMGTPSHPLARRIQALARELGPSRALVPVSSGPGAWFDWIKRRWHV